MVDGDRSGFGSPTSVGGRRVGGRKVMGSWVGNGRLV